MTEVSQSPQFRSLKAILLLRAAATTACTGTKVYVDANRDRSPHVGFAGAAGDLDVRAVRDAARLRVDLRAAAVTRICWAGPGLDLDVVLDLTSTRRLND